MFNDLYLGLAVTSRQTRVHSWLSYAEETYIDEGDSRHISIRCCLRRRSVDRESASRRGKMREEEVSEKMKQREEVRGQVATKGKLRQRQAASRLNRKCQDWDTGVGRTGVVRC